MSLTRYTTRLVTLSDTMLLREMVYEAASGVGRRPDRDEIFANPRAASFVDGWGRFGDHGVIAECDLAPVGAAWFRVFEEDDPEGGFVGGKTPELLIALVPEHRGKGVGGLLLAELIAKARDEDMPGIGLNVPRANLPAVSLFRRHGFQVVRDVDGVLTMQLALG